MDPHFAYAQSKVTQAEGASDMRIMDKEQTRCKAARKPTGEICELAKRCSKSDSGVVSLLQEGPHRITG